jgi:hypothetical protein
MRECEMGVGQLFSVFLLLGNPWIRYNFEVVAPLHRS